MESILSVLPLCNEFVVAVGNSEDGTRELIAAIGSPKIRFIDTVWDDSLREGGRVLAEETNKAFDAISPESTWAFYLQADEVIHEQYLEDIRCAMERWKDDPEVEGLLFNYKHFWGSYGYIADSHKWYRNEVRIIRNDKRIRSYRDAQGFRINGRKLNVARINASVYHYGWVKPPQAQQAKQENFNRYWHDDSWMEKMVQKNESYDYSIIDSLKPCTGNHPQVMKDRISRQKWDLGFNPTRKKQSLKNRLIHSIEKHTGWRPGEYRNYRIIASNNRQLKVPCSSVPA